jgi:hypothetical protein
MVSEPDDFIGGGIVDKDRKRLQMLGPLPSIRNLPKDAKSFSEDKFDDKYIGDATGNAHDIADAASLEPSEISMTHPGNVLTMCHGNQDSSDTFKSYVAGDQLGSYVDFHRESIIKKERKLKMMIEQVEMQTPYKTRFMAILPSNTPWLR